jgi:hypothetical protein
MNVNDILNTLEYRIRRIKSYESTLTSIKSSIEPSEYEIKNKESELKTVQESAIYYKKSQDILYEKSVGSLRELINSALRYVFYDRNYEINIVIDDKRGTKNLSFFLKDLDNDFEVSLKNGCGNGVRAVISAILKLFVLINNGKEVLVLDEKYSFISASYVENLFVFLTKICEEKELRIVMITHDERFLGFSGKMYRVSEGVISDITNSEGKYELANKLRK